MKCLIASLSEVELEILHSILDEAGIPTVIRHTALAGLPGGNQFDAELWVERDADFPKARALYDAWCEPVPESVQTWSCPGCGQRIAMSFDACWKCGAHRCAESHLPDSGNEAERLACASSDVLDELLSHPLNPS